MNARLTSKQIAVLNDIFLSELDEQSILDRHKISRNVYNKWLGEERFREEFDRRVESAYRQSEALIARYAGLAAAKLVQLTACEKEETARKACLDIMSLRRSSNGSDKVQASEGDSEDESGWLSPGTASKVLAVLAEAKRNRKKV